jgi:hypothetical protein
MRPAVVNPLLEPAVPEIPGNSAKKDILMDLGMLMNM